MQTADDEQAACGVLGILIGCSGGPGTVRDADGNAPDAAGAQDAAVTDAAVFDPGNEPRRV